MNAGDEGRKVTYDKVGVFSKGVAHFAVARNVCHGLQVRVPRLSVRCQTHGGRLDGRAGRNGQGA